MNMFYQYKIIMIYCISKSFNNFLKKKFISGADNFINFPPVLLL
jgi:hypothetical protein